MVGSTVNISVAIGTYNGQAHLREQLESIAVQTLLPTEVVIGDDASTDATYQIAEHFSKEFPNRVHLYQNPVNLGYVENFEKAISLCTGDIIAPCDQDDIWLPNRLEKIAALFSECPDCGLVFTDATVVNETLQTMGYTLYARHGKPDLCEDKIIPYFIRRLDINGCTMAFRSELRECVLPISSKWWGHDHWIVFIVAAVSRICMLDEPLMLYRRHSKSAGDDAQLEWRYVRTVLGILRNTRRAAYRQDYERWQDMFNHLTKLTQKGYSCNNVHLLKSIDLVRERLEFAQTRYLMREQKQSARILPGLKLLSSGAYSKYKGGFRTFLRDIVAW